MKKGRSKTCPILRNADFRVRTTDYFFPRLVRDFARAFDREAEAPFFFFPTGRLVFELFFPWGMADAG